MTTSGILTIPPRPAFEVYQERTSRVGIFIDAILLAAVVGIAIALLVGFAPEQAASVPNIF